MYTVKDLETAKISREWYSRVTEDVACELRSMLHVHDVLPPDPVVVTFGREIEAGRVLSMNQ